MDYSIISLMTKIKLLKAQGRKAFHASCINRSYRNRGRVARNQIKRKEKRNVLNTIIMSISKNSILLPPQKRTLESILITKMLAYSAMKMSANPPALYSTLNPETSSDSPSAKSKGARLVSAMQDTNQIRATGSMIIAGQIRLKKEGIRRILNWPVKKREKRRINASLTS